MFNMQEYFFWPEEPFKSKEATVNAVVSLMQVVINHELQGESKDSYLQRLKSLNNQHLQTSSDLIGKFFANTKIRRSVKNNFSPDNLFYISAQGMNEFITELRKQIQNIH